MRVLDVLLGATRVGQLEKIGAGEFFEASYRFSFDRAWLDDPDAPVLGLFFEDRKPRAIETENHVPVWFEHLLPPSKRPLRRAIAREAGVDEDDSFALLTRLGDDLPGALILRPGQPSVRGAGRVEQEPPRSDRPGGLRFSLAGQQWKMSLRQDERGLVVPVHGEFGDWIAKFEDPQYKELPRIEHATMRWAQLSSVRLPECRLGRADEIVNLPDVVPSLGGSIFLIRRFDRPPGARLHMEDFAQILDRTPTHIYDQPAEYIGAVLASAHGPSAQEFLQRLIFCILAGNTDAHLKNWSVTYNDGRTPELSPAYDLVSTVLYVPPLPDEMALSVGKTKRFDEIDKNSFRAMEKIFQASEAPFPSISESVQRVMGALDEVRKEGHFTGSELEKLDAHIARIPLARRA